MIYIYIQPLSKQYHNYKVSIDAQKASYFTSDAWEIITTYIVLSTSLPERSILTATLILRDDIRLGVKLLFVYLMNSTFIIYLTCIRKNFHDIGETTFSMICYVITDKLAVQAHLKR